MMAIFKPVVIVIFIKSGVYALIPFISGYESLGLMMVMMILNLFQPFKITA